ncbi:hypothetical protein [Psittacicella melopsittaci]|uniref:hypothetical protein n=1 Tax=Psittacicella melopsittaci TaxID=2028576 RepID=UPI0011C44346|nr:hypothetical protein [Psittacicella melopsittaci]
MIYFLIFTLGCSLGFAWYYLTTYTKIFQPRPQVQVINHVTYTGELEVLNLPLSTTNVEQLKDLERLQIYVYFLRELNTLYTYQDTLAKQDPDDLTVEQKAFLASSRELFTSLDFPLVTLMTNQPVVYNQEDNTYTTNLAVYSSAHMLSFVQQVSPHLILLNKNVKSLVQGSNDFKLMYMEHDFDKVQSLVNQYKKDYPNDFNPQVRAGLNFQSPDFYTVVEGDLAVFFLPLNKEVQKALHKEPLDLTYLLADINTIRKFLDLETYIENYPFTPSNSVSLGELKTQYRAALNTLAVFSFRSITVNPNGRMVKDSNGNITNYISFTAHDLDLPYVPINNFSYFTCDHVEKREFPPMQDSNGKTVPMVAMARCYQPFTELLKRFNRTYRPDLSTIVVRESE